MVAKITKVWKKERPQNKNLKPFVKGVSQTAPAASKKEWRDRKRQAQRMMDMVLKYQTLTQSELIEMSKKKDLTVLELLMIRYVTQGMKDNKMLVDMLDRHISKAPTEQKIESDINLQAKVVSLPPLDEWQKK